MKATSVEQGEQLLKLGLDRETADVLYYARICDENNIVYDEPRYDMFPKQSEMPMTKIVGWTLEALMSQMPVIKRPDKNWIYMPSLTKEFNKRDDSYCWVCGYYRDGSEPDEKVRLFESVQDDPIDAVYEVICWAFRNKERISAPG